MISYNLSLSYCPHCLFIVLIKVLLSKFYLCIKFAVLIADHDYVKQVDSTNKVFK